MQSRRQTLNRGMHGLGFRACPQGVAVRLPQRSQITGETRPQTVLQGLRQDHIVAFAIPDNIFHGVFPESQAGKNREQQDHQGAYGQEITNQWKHLIFHI